MFVRELGEAGGPGPVFARVFGGIAFQEAAEGRYLPNSDRN
jgi:hypothetical protein